MDVQVSKSHDLVSYSVNRENIVLRSAVVTVNVRCVFLSLSFHICKIEMMIIVLRFMK